MTENAEPATTGWSAPARAVDVAERFLKIGGPMEPAKLHALLYLAQGHHLAITGRALFDDLIVALSEGPVVLGIHGLHEGETVVSPGFFYEKLRQLDASPAPTTTPAAPPSLGDV